MEIRFDHMAFGGTAVILSALCAIAYCICKNRKKHRAQQPRTPWYPGPVIMQTPSPYVPWISPMNNFNHPMNHINPMDIVIDPRQQTALFMQQRPPPYDGLIAERQNSRFTELTVNSATTTPTSTAAQGQRPERPRLPSPRMINSERSIPGPTN